MPFKALPQRLDMFDGFVMVPRTFLAAAPHATPNRSEPSWPGSCSAAHDADVLASRISGGERLRAALAMHPAAEPAPRLLLIDEPTNNLDLPSLAHLTQALAAFRGAMIVVSHDRQFLHDIGVTRWLELTDEALRTGAPFGSPATGKAHELPEAQVIRPRRCPRSRVRLGLDEFGHQVDAVLIAQDGHVHAVLAEPFVAAGERHALPHHDRADVELPDQAAAVPAR